jgi:hypothetical protein
LTSDELDERVFELTRQVWAGIDCTKCANCCTTVHPTFTDQEVDRLAHRLGLQREELIRLYLEPNERGEDNPWITRSTPCPFLKDKLCSVYEDRSGPSNNPLPNPPNPPPEYRGREQTGQHVSDFGYFG